MAFLTGYVIEWSLSMDNVFVFAVIFRYFQVPVRTSTECCSGASWGRLCCGWRLCWPARN